MTFSSAPFPVADGVPADEDALQALPATIVYLFSACVMIFPDFI
jgi:hypothetical protein